MAGFRPGGRGETQFTNAIVRRHGYDGLLKIGAKLLDFVQGVPGIRPSFRKQSMSGEGGLHRDSPRAGEA